MRTVKYDDALNEAGWKMIELLAKRGPVSGRQFNDMKTCLKEVIEIYLNHGRKPAKENQRRILTDVSTQPHP
jgi:hypothetical protein